MNGRAVGGMGGLSKSLRERRVRMDRPHQLLHRALKPQRQHGFRDQLG